MGRHLKFCYGRAAKVAAAVNVPSILLVLFLNRGYTCGLSMGEISLIAIPIVSTFNTINSLWMITLLEIRLIAADISAKILQVGDGRGTQ